MIVEQCSEVDGAQTVTVGGEERLPQAPSAPPDPLTCPGLLPGVHHIHAPVPRKVGSEPLDEIAAEAGREHEVVESLPCVDLHEVKQDRDVTDVEERLGQIDGMRVGPGSPATTEDDGLHWSSPEGETVSVSARRGAAPRRTLWRAADSSRIAGISTVRMDNREFGLLIHSMPTSVTR